MLYNHVKSKIHLSVPYITDGSLQATILFHTNGASESSEFIYPMTSDDHRLWSVDVLLGKNHPDSMSVRFSVLDRENHLVDEEERNSSHFFNLGTTCDAEVHCRWNALNKYSYTQTAAIDTLMGERLSSKKFPYISKGNMLSLLLNMPPVEPHHQLVLVGNQPVLGRWDVKQAFSLNKLSSNSWNAIIKTEELQFPLEYKYVLLDTETQEVVWEEGENRRIEKIPQERFTLYEEALPQLPFRSFRSAGIVVPLFSLRSTNSYGVGDFMDLVCFIKWAAKVDLKVIQLLPINDTRLTGTWMDSYPYNPISSYAIHPIYISPSLLPLKNKNTSIKFSKEASRLTNLPQVDYEKALDLKMRYLHAYVKENGGKIMKSDDYLNFVKKNSQWIYAYQLYLLNRQHFGTSDFRSWPKEVQFQFSDMEVYEEEMGEVEANFDIIVQFLLYKQARMAHDIAKSHQIVLKGDIPVGVSRDGVRAWAAPDYLNCDSQAGAPPDFFSEHGQNWGFPTNNWKTILENDGGVFAESMKYMSNFFDAYRIDHILGYLRIWEIPYNQISGMLGHFNPALPLTADEIRWFGFQADVEQLTVPTLSEEELRELLPEITKSELRKFFDKNTEGFFELRPKWRSQRTVSEQIPEGTLRDGLMKAATQVLFLHDPHKEGYYHPAISGSNTYPFHRLQNSDQEAFNRLQYDFFFSRHDNFWAEQAPTKLACITDSTRMLPCAEDLGMVPACMRNILNQQQILSLEVESMPKYSSYRFADVNQNPFLSVDTITTHDMYPLRLWWKQNAEAAQDYYNNVLHHEGQRPELMSGELCEEVIRRHLQSPSMFCILSFQDWLGMDEKLRSEDLESEQINDPANPHHYWRYRIPLFMEDLSVAFGFNERIKQLIKESGR